MIDFNFLNQDVTEISFTCEWILRISLILLAKNYIQCTSYEWKNKKTFKFPVKYDVHVVTKWQLNKTALQYSTFLALLKLKKYMYMQEYTCNLRYLYKHHFPLIDSPLSGGDGEVSILSFNVFQTYFCCDFCVLVLLYV